MKPIKEGKVREIYDNGDSLIMVATDRISCFDVILKLSLIHISEPTRLGMISYAVFCLKKKKKSIKKKTIE